LLGIIFTGGESPPPQVILNLLKDKNVVIVAADSGLLAAEKAGIKPDYIVGDMDSLDASRLDAYPGECVMRYAKDKDYTDTELAFSLLREKGCDCIWIAGGGGGRIDHLLAIRCLFEREVFPCRWLTEASDIHCVDANADINALSTKLEKSAAVSVFPAGSGPWEAKSEGLKWPLEGPGWDRGSSFGISNAAPDGDFSITAVKGRFLIVLPLPIFE
jgi:thiamine pyrophosphokinase